MTKRLGLIVLAVTVVLLLGIVLLVVLRSRPAPPPEGRDVSEAPVNEATGGDGAEEPDDGPDIEVSGTELTISEEGEVVWRASFGGNIEFDEDQNVAHATNVLWEFAGEGFEGMTLEAPMMRADWDEGRLRFSDGIAIDGEGGELRFTANSAEYQFDTRKIIGRGDVRFKRGHFYGRAEEVVVDNNRRVVRLKRGSLTRRE